MLAITVMLLNRDRVTARELAEKFDVSVRTIYRDLEAIDLAGIPIVSYSGNKGGYGIMDTYRIDRQYLTFDDIVSMVSTLRGINTALENRELDTAIEKITSLVPGHKSDDFKKYSQQIVVDILPMGYTRKQKDRLKTVHQAVNAQCLLSFEYCNTKGERTKRTVEPMTLIFKGYAWYLFGFCLLKTDYRIFRLSRMNHPAVIGESFTRRDKSYNDAFSPDPDTLPMVHLVLRFSPRVRIRVEDFFDPEQIRYEKDGHMVLTVDFPEDQWVYSFLLGYGEDVEVLEPVHIQHILMEKAKKILKIYKPDIQVSQD
jgi:predicted DNA-binding transcriptional regulator YafY